MNVKDAVITKAIRMFVESWIKEYGELKEFETKTSKKTIFFTILLYGEDELTECTINGIRLGHDEEGAFIKFRDINTSKEWINILFAKYLPYYLEDNKIEIPSALATVLNKVL